MRLKSILLLLVLAAPSCTSQEQRRVLPDRRDPDPVMSIAVVAQASDVSAESIIKGARLAASEIGRDKLLPGGIEITMASAASAASLAGLTDDEHVLGAITIGGAEIISAAQEVLASSSFAVLEARDDLYERSLLGPSIFQMSPPHGWQAFRLARYFGPGDRNYRTIGLAREPGPAGEVVAGVMKKAAESRRLQLIDSPGDSQGAIASLRSRKPEAVVVEGSPAFISATVNVLSTDGSSAYAGRARIKDGWRPQIAGFESLLGHKAHDGAVAAGDYASPAQSDGRIERVESFRSAMRSTYKQDPSGDEIYGYEAVRSLVEAAKRSGANGAFDKATRIKLIEELERFDRVRFSHLPISLGPDDHVFAERDVLGLYAFDNQRWLHLMRTFTSDLERTNLLEEDWLSYFEGAVPGGEAPFFHQSKGGIVSDRSDDLR